MNTTRTADTLRRMAASLVMLATDKFPQTEANLRHEAKIRDIPLDYLDTAIGLALVRGEVKEVVIFGHAGIAKI
jgi:hypothetical protein